MDGETEVRVWTEKLREMKQEFLSSPKNGDGDEVLHHHMKIPMLDTPLYYFSSFLSSLVLFLHYKRRA
jgi:hypothetical protein